MSNQFPNTELDFQLDEHLSKLNILIRTLKERSLAQAFVVRESYNLPLEEVINIPTKSVIENGQECLRLRNKIEDALSILEDIKDNSIDRLGPLGRSKIDQMIAMCEENINGFDKIRNELAIVDEKQFDELGLNKLIAMERSIIRHKDLSKLLNDYSQCILSSKCNPNFKITSDPMVARLIERIRNRKEDLVEALNEVDELFGSSNKTLAVILTQAEEAISHYEKLKKEETGDQKNDSI
ncbi:MAG: hypothetical protein NC548_28390 [Lachnospiraceae bacterium]|nr:hypothetical protein [Lachnospiraceae bacterium]MCM1232009.1 hypothetical protein [Ruminococcus flavefaciens]